MNTQQGSSAGLNTVNYVIFLNISDSAVSACEELPGSQIQSDRSSPPSRPGDGEKLLSIALNHPETEGSCRAALLLRAGCLQAFGFVGSFPSFQRARQGNVSLFGGALSCTSSLTEVWEIKCEFHCLAQRALGLRADKRHRRHQLVSSLYSCLFFLSPPSPLPWCSRYLSVRNISYVHNSSVSHSPLQICQ